jgi:hypothetical protein
LSYAVPDGDPWEPPVLRAMKLVMSRSAAEDETEYERSCRRWKGEDEAEFMMKLGELEKAALVVKQKADETDQQTQPGTEAAVGCAKEWLARHGEKS